VTRILRLLLALVLIAGSAAAFAPVSAQTGRTVYIETTDFRTGESITTACYVFVDYSQEGCDENGDGRISFQGMPAADFIVTQTVRAPGYLPMGDFPVTIHENGDGQLIRVQLARSDGVNRGPFDISIAPFNIQTNDPVSGGCFVLNGGSLEGCDENGDARVTFDGVAAGTYLLSQTVASPGYLLRAPAWIVVSANGLIRVGVAPRVPEPPASAELPDVSIVTRDGEGTLLRGACYIIIDASIEGCDENGDGQVDYRDVRPGTWTVTQTQAPGNFDPVDDFEITITPEETQSFTVNQAGWGPDSTIVSLIAIDADTGRRIASVDVCFIVIGGSIEGCDNNLDGQVDYFGIQPGRYSIEITSAPDGYLPYDVPLDIQVLASGSQQFFWIPFVPR
jgi:hypothetical protein